MKLKEKYMWSGGGGSRGRHISVSPTPNMGAKTGKLRILGFSAQFFSPASYHSSELTYLLLLLLLRRRRRWLRVIGRIPFFAFPPPHVSCFWENKVGVSDGRTEKVDNEKLFSKRKTV